MKRKVIAGLLLSSCVLGVAMPVFAQDGTEADLQEDYSGQNSVEIEVNGTLGADNTNPGATITEGDDNWINVTVPTKTIFYNTAKDPVIKSPDYKITNNSGRPVSVSLERFENDDTNTSLTLPSSYSLNLQVEGKQPISNIATSNTSTDFTTSTPLIDLANKDGRMALADEVDASSNVATFKYTGTANATTQVQPKYTMTLKFDAVAW
ncbi:hypothetical protein [Enterococcus sp. SMC-9]|uniref:hypothetical protein n=1 Tax=Enterococcus sp. SMC-9 TaxID=2862343 RepID=UPI001E32EDE4|nr:hypothetical protein [Enterococcus sp. SMC-9]MCD1024039.1 hypothetical protein [Enterococcus sp. SMC-9]